MDKKFSSAVDWWYYGIIAFTVVVLAGTWISLPNTLDSVSSAVFIASAVFALGLPLWMLFSTYYLISGPELIIRSGPFKWKVTISTIQSITPTRSPLSSPALSLNRLEIKHGSGRVVLVSPANHEQFIEALSNAN
ncbi:MAG: PH domain-containing protein [Pseudomonadaceae bacterium]|nr:PH domain-containing protein [Pseudomonadaceae bacterium]